MMRNRGIVLLVAAALLVASVAVAAEPPMTKSKGVKATPTAAPRLQAVDFSKFPLFKLGAANPKLKLPAAAGLAASVLAQTREISCGIYVYPAPNPADLQSMYTKSGSLFFVNTTGQTLPVGTQIEWKVSGVPSSCCHGYLAPLQVPLEANPPTQHYVLMFNPVVNPPQEWVRQCQAWAHPPKP